MTSNVTVAAHCAEEKEVVVKIFNPHSPIPETFTLQNGEVKEFHIYDGKLVSTYEQLKSNPDWLGKEPDSMDSDNSEVMEPAVKMAASHPDYPVLLPEELVALNKELVQAIERCGASPELTHAVTLASDLGYHLNRFIQSRDAVPSTGSENIDDLVQQAKSLLDLDAKGALTPHGIGSHARSVINDLIKVAYSRKPDMLPVPDSRCSKCQELREPENKPFIPQFDGLFDITKEMLDAIQDYRNNPELNKALELVKKVNEKSAEFADAVNKSLGKSVTE